MTDGLFDDREYATWLSQVEKFVVPPTSVLDAAQGYWRTRRAMWTASYPMLADSGGRHDLGSGGFEHLANGSDDTSRRMAAVGEAATIFDPVLAEIVYSWWSRGGDVVFDPFAGGPTRGIVAAALGRSYIGLDIREEQVDANENVGIPGARWITGDAAQVAAPPCDLIFSCPPYGSLERYSDHPSDLSTMDWGGFVDAYRRAVARAVDALRADRFAVFVVGNFKERRQLRDLAGLTVQAFGEAGADYYGDLVLVPCGGSAALRAAVAFPKNRRPMPRHQWVLVFVKGNPDKAAGRLTTVKAAT